VEEVFQRTAYRLQIITLRSSTGIEQTIQTTAEHPVYALQQGWVEAGKLQAGDTIAEPNGAISTITAVRTERHPQGIAVYNFRVQDAHTYFVRAEGSTAEPVWVHNAGGAYGAGEVPAGTSLSEDNHNLVARLMRNGTLIDERQFVSGELTPEEIELGRQQGIGWRIGDTENRAIRVMDIQEGDVLSLHGQFEPCATCQQTMINRAMETGAEIEYHFLDNANQLRIWSAQQQGYIYVGA
jgi:hypothetical protein